MAVGDDAGAWFLINASPDLTAQVRAFPDFQPSPGALRGSFVSGLLLTNADLDHVLGIFSLREGGQLHVHAPRAVRDTLDSALNLTPVMNSFCGLTWYEPPVKDFAPLRGAEGKETSLSYRAIELPARQPLFDKRSNAEGVHSVAYQIMDRKTGGRLLVAPDVGACTGTLAEAIRESDGVLFDGTFWSDDELSRIKPGSRSATEMGHVPVKDGSMPLLRSARARHKIYLHVNNTNPMLSPGAPERAEVEAAGIRVGHDGLEFVI